MSPIKQFTMNRLIILYLCACALKSPAQTLDTLTQLNQLTQPKAYYKAPNGKVYKIKIVKADWVDGEDNLSRDPLLSQNCLDSLYSGQDRDSAKTSVVKSVAINVPTVSDLIRALPKDSIMRKKVTKTSKRLPEEKKNVRLMKDTYLFAFAKEDDGDYHLIIGDHPKAEKATFLNVEISGLPINTSQPITQVRRTFDARFLALCSSDYVVFDMPLRIEIQGSLFFDISHSVGQVGPPKMKPKTNWEIHPVSKIIFID
jgi:hypothetical protein